MAIQRRVAHPNTSLYPNTFFDNFINPLHNPWVSTKIPDSEKDKSVAIFENDTFIGLNIVYKLRFVKFDQRKALLPLIMLVPIRKMVHPEFTDRL
jgi:hypothetical protein